MRRILITCMLLCSIGLVAHAQAAEGVPPLINYQGRLTDANGQGLSGTHKLAFNIYDAASGGAMVWGPQTFVGVPLMDGHFNVILGTTDSAGRSISNAFGANNRYLGIKIDDGAEISPRQQILSAPYSIVAGTASSAETAREVRFAPQNTDWANIFFESTGDGEHLSNIVFETRDNGDEGFIFRTYGTTPVERVRIDNRGLIVKEGNLTVNGTITSGGRKVITSANLVFENCYMKQIDYIDQLYSCNNSNEIVRGLKVVHWEDAWSQTRSYVSHIECCSININIQ